MLGRKTAFTTLVTLSKYLISRLTLMMLIPLNSVMATEVPGEVLEESKEKIDVSWKWNNNISTPFKLTINAVHWDIKLRFSPRKEVKGKATHKTAPHEKEQKEPDAPLCFAVNQKPTFRVTAPNADDHSGETECGAKVFHTRESGHSDYHLVYIWPPEMREDKKWSARWTAIHGGPSVYPPEAPSLPLLLELASFQTTSTETDNYISWVTSSEINNAGFRLWRGTKTRHGEVSITVFGGKELTNHSMFKFFDLNP